MAPIWPNFYVVGAIKCGTTSIYAHLKRHPEVFLPDVKEPHFFVTLNPFARPEYANLWVREAAAYQKLYEGAEGYAAVGDLSPSYLWDPTSAGRIHEVCPDAKIIIVLRDPVERAYSHYLMEWRHNKAPSTFWKALQEDFYAEAKGLCITNLYVEMGLYYGQVQRYFKTFGEERVLVCLFGEFRNSRALFGKIARHIGVSEDPLDSIDLNQAFNTFRVPRNLKFHMVAKKLVPAVARREINRVLQVSSVNKVMYTSKKPPLDERSRRFLQDIYRDDVDRLKELLGRDLPELRESWLP